MDQTFAAASPDPLEGRPEPDSAAPPPRPSSTAGWL
ncbi:long-chain-acyl-CoA synthetase, partial [Methylorubrum extorquens DSM 13060]